MLGVELHEEVCNKVMTFYFSFFFFRLCKRPDQLYLIFSNAIKNGCMNFVSCLICFLLIIPQPKTWEGYIPQPKQRGSGFYFPQPKFLQSIPQPKTWEVTFPKPNKAEGDLTSFSPNSCSFTSLSPNPGH